MMRKFFAAAGAVSAFVVCALSVGGSPVNAQNASAYNHSANISQAIFADRGCINSRVASVPTATWVPRINRKRDVPCGVRPSLPTTAHASAVHDPLRIATARSIVPTLPATTNVGVLQRLDREQLNAQSAPWKSETSRFYNVAAKGVDAYAVGTQLIAPSTAPASVPKGFRPAWNDGRLNPNRGKQLLSGALQSALIWTQTVPRRLVDPTSGADVTRNYKYLIYPYTDYARQKRDLAGGRHITVKVNGQRMIVAKSRLQETAGGRTVLSTK